MVPFYYLVPFLRAPFWELTIQNNLIYKEKIFDGAFLLLGAFSESAFFESAFFEGAFLESAFLVSSFFETYHNNRYKIVDLSKLSFGGFSDCYDACARREV